MFNVPKIKDLHKDMKLAPIRKHEAEARAEMTHLYGQIREMARMGYTGIHTHILNQLSERAPHLAKDAFSALRNEGYSIRATDTGHQIEWPDVKREEPSS